ncbi:MAG: diadenosine tetraphosphate (Ap4A) [Planctomycetota bacterium]|nr:MAG: diadenosine tetraphosphate (Ap4A) [Planctomycetota bacterium]
MDYKCGVCGFELWRPVALLPHASIGLYSDARFPGRALVSAREHFDEFTLMPKDLWVPYLEEVRLVATAIQRATGATRVNYALLGNAESHVHFHLFPRNPGGEPKPDKSPWDDPRPREELSDQHASQVVESIRKALRELSTHSISPREV